MLQSIGSQRVTHDLVIDNMFIIKMLLIPMIDVCKHSHGYCSHLNEVLWNHASGLNPSKEPSIQIGILTYRDGGSLMRKVTHKVQKGP